jgi:hypothetical protein
MDANMLKKHGLTVIKAYSNDVELNLMVDTGANINLIDERFINEGKIKFEKATNLKRLKLVGINGSHTSDQYLIEFALYPDYQDVKKRRVSYTANFVKWKPDAQDTNHGIHIDGILCPEFLRLEKARIDYDTKEIISDRYSPDDDLGKDDDD